MKRILNRIAGYGMAFLAAGILSKAGPVYAQESKYPVNLQASIDVLDKNVFRGVTYSKKPVLQPNIRLTCRDFLANIWLNTNIIEQKLTEVDYTLGYNKKPGKRANLSLGYTLYTFPNPFGDNTQEFYLGGGLEGLLNPNFTLFGDFDQGKGFYGELSLGHEFKSGPNVNAKLHYNWSYFREGSGLSHGIVVFSKSFPFKGVTLSPRITLAKSLSNDFKNEIFGGLNISF